MTSRADSILTPYDLEGEGAETVAFVPALGLDRRMWRFQIEHFLPRYRVLSYDAMQPNVYREHPSLEPYAERLYRLLQSLEVGPVHVVGISMGGMTGQLLALRHPEAVRSLVLVSTTSSYLGDAREQLEQRPALVESEGMAPLVEPTLRRWFTQQFHQEQPDVVQQIREVLAAADPRAYAQAARAVASIETTDKLRTIVVPTLILKAESDASMPSDSAETLASSIPLARLTLIPHAAHLCNIENAPAFNEEVSRFLDDV